MSEPETPGATVPWGRTNLLIAQAALSLGARALPLGSRHTDAVLRLIGPAGRSVVVAKTRSPYLTQVAQALTNLKQLSRELLERRGVPVPPCVLLDERDLDAPSGMEQARRCLHEWHAVVVKPNSGNRALGVNVDLRDEDTLARAVAWSRELDRDEEVVIEPFMPGMDLRISVIGGQARAAVQVVRPELPRGSSQSVAAWIDELNLDPRRMDWAAPSLLPFDRIEVDETLRERLAVLNRELGAPGPHEGDFTLLGEELALIDWTHRVDPAWLTVAERACTALGVDVGGVDLRGPADAFTRPPGADRSAAVLEVNTLPALHLHALPTEGAPRPVFEDFVRYCLQLPGSPPICARVDV